MKMKNSNKIFADKLAYYMRENNISQSDLINDLNLNKSTVSTWCRGIKLPRMETLNILASYFNIQKSDLLEDEPRKVDIFSIDGIEPLPKSKKVPLLGDVAAGRPIFAYEMAEEYLNCDSDADFCLRVKGDSMINARILDGDIVFIKRQNLVENGEIGCVVIEDEATLKRVYIQRNGKNEMTKLTLISENPIYEPFVFVGEELNHIIILGKAVAFKSPVK